MRAALGRYLVPGGDAPPYYSVRLAEAPKHTRQTGFSFLYRGSTPVVRTRDPRRAVDALFQHLAGHDEDDLPELLRVAGVALVTESAALLAPATLRRDIAQIERKLRLGGLRVVDTPWVLVDSASHEVVVPDDRLTIDRPHLAGLFDLAANARPDPPVAPGRYSISHWVFNGTERVSSAEAVAFGARLTAMWKGLDAQMLLDRLAELVRGVRVATLPLAEPSTAVDELVALA